ncbi:sulfotransferase family 2 domain-containing protein [Arthrospira platensis NCB002]|uniref:sulfotransferase family 2 domain-containing protein n=1 Tax=Limnospira platensis TaxID=118562 RepID=UPI0001D0EC0D|nr:sulfotransferase family 2 domain-containing protein [Arthrospira platensis NCB002]BAI91566.1 hypothetical protein NIES39_J05200 [Arthrospira platensis NIES-39]BDT13863.1 hypothetical protein N39L_35860 [Arthrospira platensis NIES-39]
MPRQCYVFNDKKLVLFWSPKCACTAITHWLYYGLLGNLTSNKKPQQAPRTLLAKQGFFRSINTYEDLEKISNYDGYLKVIFMRHPMSRLISAYLNKFVYYNGKILDEFHKLEPFSKKVVQEIYKYNNWDIDQNYKGIRFRDLIDYVKLNKSKNKPIDHHWDTQVYDSYNPQLFSFDYIFQQEKFVGGINQLNNIFNIDYVPPQINSTINYRNQDTSNVEYYDILKQFKLDDLFSVDILSLNIFDEENLSNIDTQTLYRKFINDKIINSVYEIYKQDYQVGKYDKNVIFDISSQKNEVSAKMKSFVNWKTLETQRVVRGWILPEYGICEPSDIIVLINGKKLTDENINLKRFHKNSDTLQVNFCLDLSPYNLKNGDKIQLAFRNTGNILGTSQFIEQSSPSCDDNTIYLFIHIPKTAGTSFRKGLEKQFNPSQVIYDYGIESPVTSPIIKSSIYGESASPLQLKDYVDEKKIKVIGGHIGGANQRDIKHYCSIFGSRLKLVTFLREPIRRCLSNYFHMYDHYGYSGTVETFVKQRPNLQSIVLKDIDMENLYFLGITEKYNESVEFFNRISQTSVPSLTLNKNPKIENFIQNLPQSTLDLVVENNALDLELYKAGVQLFERRFSESRESNKTVTSVNFHKKLSPHEVGEILFNHQPKPLYNESLNLTLIFCAKSACSFGLKWFFYHAGLYQEVESYHPQPHMYKAKVFMANPKYRKQLRATNKIIHSNIVCLVRDPFSRAVSSYLHAIKTGYDNPDISKFLGRKISRKNSFCFDEFVQYLKSLDIRNCNIHHKLQAHPLIEMDIIKPHLLKVENLFNDFADIEKTLGLSPAPLEQISKSLDFHKRPRNHGFQQQCHKTKFRWTKQQLFPHYKYFYSQELVRDIANIYRADFEIFGYKSELDLELTSQAPSQPSLTQIEKDMLKWRDDLNKIRG